MLLFDIIEVWVDAEIGVRECTMSSRRFYDNRIALVKREFVSRCTDNLTRKCTYRTFAYPDYSCFSSD